MQMKTFALRQLLAATASAEGSLTPGEGRAEPGLNPRRTLLLRNETRARWPPISEALLLACALHIYSGQRLQNLSGVDMRTLHPKLHMARTGRALPAHPARAQLASLLQYRADNGDRCCEMVGSLFEI